jgi:SHS2 domain-containing protein
VASSEPAPFEILEHTADIGVRAAGATVEEAYENSCLGLLEILGARSSSPRREERVALDAADPEALLVALMDELIYRTEVSPEGVAGVRVRLDGPSSLVATIVWGDRDPVEGPLELKAATYHQLSLRRTGEGWEAMVYFDV